MIKNACTFALAIGLAACSDGSNQPATGAPPLAGPADPASPTAVSQPKGPAVVPVPEGSAWGPTAGRTLTNTEYRNTLLDVLGYDISGRPDTLPEDSASTATGFIASAGALSPSGARTSKYERAAVDVAWSVPWVGGLDRYAECAEMTVACQQAFVSRLLSVLYRRPVEVAEANRMATLFGAVDPADPTPFEAGARMVLQAGLQSMNFLFVLERLDWADPTTGAAAVAPHEMATRLALLLWKSGPDEALLKTFAAPTLDVRAAIETMLADSRMERGVRGYTDEWLQLFLTPRRPTNLQRGITDTFLKDSREETLRFVARLAIHERADLRSLFTDTTTELTAELAGIYGLPSQGAGFQRYTLAPDSGRQGLLTQPAFLGARAGADHASILDRGLLILRSLMCMDLKVPPGLNVQPLADAPNIRLEMPEREKFAVHEEDPVCASCHKLIDPLGFPFEVFDVAGRYQTQDDYGNAVRGDGVALVDNVEVAYQNAQEFSTILADSSVVQRCMAEKMHKYVFGRDDLPGDRLVRDEITQAFIDGGRTYDALIRAVVLGDAFAFLAPVE